MEYIKTKGLEQRVILKDFTSNPYPYIKNSKGLVLSSRLEGLPTVLIEALALGVPVASTDCPTGPKEILTDELAEFLSPVDDVNALANNLRKLVEHPPKITAQHIAKFSKEVNLPKYLSLLGNK